MMSPRERWLAALRLQPVDRLPFWPKLDGAYPRTQDGPFRKMDVAAIHNWIGSDKHVGIPGCVRESRTATSIEEVREGNVRRTLFRTPLGCLERVCRFDPASNSWHPMTFPVRTREDIRVMTGFFADARPELDRPQLEMARADAAAIGEDAVTAHFIGESALMHWVEWLAGVEHAHLLLADYPHEVEELFDAMHQLLLGKTRILAEHSPSDMIYLVENTSTTLISPAQYRRFCKPHILEYARIMKSANRLLVIHMCGHLKALLPDLADLPLAGFEAFTSPTVGNTTLLDGRMACPDKCLIGGTNAALWTLPAEDIIARIRDDLDPLPHHRGIVVTSAGVMPPRCAPETIKAVADWVKAYPHRS